MSIKRTISITAQPDLKDDRNAPHYVPAPCQTACPVGTDAPSYIGYAWEGKWEEAFEAITATNPFSAICGRVCDAPCERKCRRGEHDGPVAIRNIKRFVLDQLGEGYALPPVAVTRNESVAIVGGGPAGLTAAQDLSEAGFRVHLYEASDRLGGMAVWGIPRFRLPEGIIKQDIDRILKHCPGIEVHYNAPLGAGLTLDDLKAKHDVVILAIGAGKGRKMAIPGDDRPEVVDGISFLHRINSGEHPTLPSSILVIGGGDVAMDACRVALRLPGVKEVKVLYRRGPDEMPARADELKGALHEGVDIVYHTQPHAVIEQPGGGIALRCVNTRAGAPGKDGRRLAETIPGSEHDIECGLIIAAVGQKAENADLERRGLMNGDRVRADFATMSTADPRVFAAGDGGFGGSSIIEAVAHGHRVAYYVKARLDRNEKPLPYEKPLRTRRVAPANDSDWEVIPVLEQKFNGIGKDPLAFQEVEDTFPLTVGKRAAARCFRCDAETGSSEYSVKARETVISMSRLADSDEQKQGLLYSRLAGRTDPFGDYATGLLDEIVFLPANLTRLVIDPYREDCKTTTEVGRVALDSPILIGGFDDAPEEIRSDVAAAAAKQGIAYLGSKRLSGVPWLQLCGNQPPSPEAAIAIIADVGAVIPSRARVDQPLGVVATAGNVKQTIRFALENRLDVVLLDATGSCSIAGELKGAPDLTLIRDAIVQLRELDREESVDLIFYGGIRTGTDLAKLLALGTKAIVSATSLAFAVGGSIGEDGTVSYASEMNSDERQKAAALFITSMVSEASMMARCTGKTSLVNLEPEDLRAYTVATSRATGIILPGRNAVPVAMRN
jgi:NADPH-dependent glutamate synthase beta subunit-like oxidoreductase